MFMVPKSHTRITAWLLTATMLLSTPTVLAHAFPEDAQPGAGAVLSEAPNQVRIRFDSRLEREFSVIIVKDAHGNRVSGKTKLDPTSLQTLEASLQDLVPGDYHVYWAVVSWDGHRTKGDYVFHLRPH